MITVIDLYRNIKDLLEEMFPDITVQIKDIKNPVPPCFYIKLVSVGSSQSAVEYKTDNITFDIIYFSENEELLDLLEIQEALQILFEKPLSVTKLNEDDITLVEINDCNFSLDENDYILHCTIDIELIQGLEPHYDGYSSDELMEELEIVMSE